MDDFNLQLEIKTRKRFTPLRSFSQGTVRPCRLQNTDDVSRKHLQLQWI